MRYCSWKRLRLMIQTLIKKYNKERLQKSSRLTFTASDVKVFPYGSRQFIPGNRFQPFLRKNLENIFFDTKIFSTKSSELFCLKPLQTPQKQRIRCFNKKLEKFLEKIRIKMKKALYKRIFKIWIVNRVKEIKFNKN